MKSKLLLLSLSILILASCSSNRVSPVAKFIPKNVPMVFSMNIGNLVKKSGTDIANLDAYQKLRKNIRRDDKQMAKMLDNIVKDPTSTGINFRKPFYLMAYPDGDVNFMLFYASVSNKKKVSGLMETFGENLDKDTKFILDETNHYSSFELRNYDNSAGTAIIGWNKKVVIGMFPIQNGGYYGKRGSDYQERLEDLMELETDKSLASNSDFVSFSKQNRDVSAWMSYEELLDVPSFSDVEEDLDVDLSDTYLTMFLDFKKDEIVMSSKLKPGKALKKDIKKVNFLGKGVSKDFIQLLPASTIFSGSMALKPDAIIDMMNEYNIFDDANDNWEKQFGITFEEMMESIEGDIVFGLTDFKEETKKRRQINWDTYQYETVVTDMLQAKFAVFGKLKDDKVVKKILRDMKAIRKGDYYQIGEDGEENISYIKADDDLFVFSNDESIIKGDYDKMTTGQPINLATKNPMMMNLKFNFKIQDNMRAGLKHLDFGLDAQRFYELLQDNYQGLTLEMNSVSNSEMRLVSKSNSDKNSLTKLMKIFEEMFDKEAHKKYFEKHEKDLIENVIIESADSVIIEDDEVEKAIEDNTETTEMD